MSRTENHVYFIIMLSKPREIAKSDFINNFEFILKLELPFQFLKNFQCKDFFISWCFVAFFEAQVTGIAAILAVFGRPDAG